VEQDATMKPNRVDQKQAINDDLTNDDESRGDIFDGVPGAPLPPVDDLSPNIDFGQGSGIIINSEGYILTNAHVVEKATSVFVTLADGRRFKARLLGADDIVDVAILKIVPELGLDDESDEHRQLLASLPVAELGDSDVMEVGNFVTAIGSPGGLDNTCTIGIISGLQRCPRVVGIPDKFGVLDYIQTDASINQGNSGGPLVDVESGNIVGINTCIRANMEGTSFAIPINKVMGLVDDLSEGKHISHGYLGVHLSTMNPTLARYSNKLRTRGNAKIPVAEGVMIERVYKNSPASAGGLKKYDFVTEIGGQPVAKADDAHVVIDRATIGEEISVKVVRNNQEITVQVKPEDLSPRLKQLREERLKQRKSKSKDG
jgi:S1-C subfamily serine protease